MVSRRHIRALAALAVGATAGATLVGCGSSTPSSTTSPAAASTPVPLVLYAAEGYDSAMATAFQKATGIPVKLDDDSTGPLLTKVQAEKNNPQWGVLWVDGNTAFAALDQQGLLSPFTPAATYTAAGQALVPSDHSYIPTGTTVMAAAICNTKDVARMPTSYQDLMTSTFKNKLGMNDPSQSGPTYPFIAGVMAQMGGESQGETYFSSLKSNGLKVFPTNGDTLHALETQQIGCGLIQSSAATGELLKVKPTATYSPKIAYLPKTTLLPSVIGIDAGAPAQVKAEAQKFVNYVLSPAGQAVMLSGDPNGDSLFWPIVSGVSANPKLGAMPAFQSIDPKQWGPLEGQVNTWFDSTIK